MPNFNWQPASHACLIECSNDPNSKGNNNDVSGCFCKDGYQWNSSNNMCESTASNQTTAIVILGVMLGLLMILSVFLLVKIRKARRKNNPSMIVTADHQMMRDEDM
jgi:hypothetical protein